MTLWGWIRVKLHGTLCDPEKMQLISEIEHETSRLNGAQVELSKNVNSLKSIRLQRRRDLDSLLDETLEALRKEERH